MATVKTTKIADKFDYALVPDRIIEFRGDHPRADISHQETLLDDGSMIIRATIVKDVTEPSAKATGSARYSASEMKIKKAYEKLETIATGRALAMLGYTNDGKVASTEEMDEYNAYKNEQIELAVDTLTACQTMEDLKKVWNEIGIYKSDPRVINAKDLRKDLLQERADDEKN